jgi:hypothetical protein
MLHSLFYLEIALLDKINCVTLHILIQILEYCNVTHLVLRRGTAQSDDQEKLKQTNV